MTIDEAIEQFKYDAECNRADLDLSFAEDNDKVAEWLEELKQYRAIGTPKECRETVEKQKAKKPQKTESEGYRYTDTYRCPNCGGNFSGTGIANYCYHCGQKLDWEGAERGDQNEYAKLQKNICYRKIQP